MIPSIERRRCSKVQMQHEQILLPINKNKNSPLYYSLYLFTFLYICFPFSELLINQKAEWTEKLEEASAHRRLKTEKSAVKGEIAIAGKTLIAVNSVNNYFYLFIFVKKHTAISTTGMPHFTLSRTLKKFQDPFTRRVHYVNFILCSYIVYFIKEYSWSCKDLWYNLYSTQPICKNNL